MFFLKKGKLMLIGAMFRCASPALTLAAALGARTPFLSPMEKRSGLNFVSMFHLQLFFFCVNKEINCRSCRSSKRILWRWKSVFVRSCSIVASSCCLWRSCNKRKKGWKGFWFSFNFESFFFFWNFVLFPFFCYSYEFY